MKGIKIEMELRLENDEPGNTWFSLGWPDEPDVQLHVDRALWVGLGRPQRIRILVEGATS